MMTAARFQLLQRLLSRAWVAVFAIGACTSAGTVDPSTTVVDSAGVRIVTSSIAAFHDLPVFEVVPEKRVGAAESADTAQFLQGVRGPIILSDGRIVLLDAASSTMRFYDASGRELYRRGRRGSGPGEFPGGIFGIFRCTGDTILVREQRRVSIFNSTGTYVGVQRIAASRAGAAATILNVTPDCHGFVATEGAGPPVTKGDRFVSKEVVRTVDRSGKWSDSLLAVDGPTGAMVTHMGRTIPSRIPWSAIGLVKVTDSLLIDANTAVPEIRFRDLGGRLRHIIRWHRDEELISALDRALFDSKRAAFVRLYPDERQQIPEIAALPVPRVKPVFSNFLVAADGALWVREYSNADAGFPGIFDASSDSTTARWRVFDRQGRPLRWVVLPSGFNLTWAEGDRLMGVRFNEDDEESVVLARLKPQSRGKAPSATR